MEVSDKFGVTHLLSKYRFSMMGTWVLLIIENTLLAMIPLAIGFTIDQLLTQQYWGTIYFFVNMLTLIIISVLRRAYDTRVYGTIRVDYCSDVNTRMKNFPISVKNARITLARELVDFFENELPDLLSSLIQIIVALIILTSTKIELGLSSIVLLGAMFIFYTTLHNQFFRLNGGLNNQLECQIKVLNRGNAQSARTHLKRLRFWEVKLSDTEAILYGAIYVLIAIFMAYNLWVSTSISDIKPGKLFSIVSYSWEYVEAAIMLPITLQSWTRLKEIQTRLNNSVCLEK